MKAKEYQISLIQLIMNLKMSEGGYCGVKINTNNDSFPEEYRVKCESSSSFFVRACKLSEEKDGLDYKDNPVLNRKVKDIQTKIAHWNMHNEIVLEDKYSRDVCPERVNLTLLRFPADDVRGPAYQVVSDQAIVINGGEKNYFPILEITLEEE